MRSISNLAEKIPREVWETIWKLPDEITIPDWVEKNIILSEKMAAEPGLLRISRTPYIRGPLEALGNVFIEEIVLVWGRQLGKSTGIQYSFACYIVAQDPGPATFLLPTREKAKEIQETRLDPIFRSCPEVVNRMPENPDDYTKLRMNFQTMVFAMAWAGSDTQTTTRSNRYLFIDEADEIPKHVGPNAIDPIKGIEQTTTTFSNRKIIKTSTPTTPQGNIWQALKECNLVFELWLPCPRCGAKQILYWDNVRFGENHDPVVVEEIAYYECEACQGRISNFDKIRILNQDEWRGRTTPDPCDQIMKDIRTRIDETISLDDALASKRYKKIGFYLPKWYSPFPGGTFGIISKELIEANRALKEGEDYAPLRNWIMYNAAKPWEQVFVPADEVELSKNEVNIPPLVCPKGTIAITAGIDPGQDGFWYAVIAWKADYGPHLIHSGWLSGSYDEQRIDDFVKNNIYEVQDERRQLHIWRIGIDTGGGEIEGAHISMTAAAYEWIRRMHMRDLFGTKGLSRDIPKRLKQIRIDRMPGDKGVKIPGGLTLIEMNTDALKDLVWFRLNRNVLLCQKCTKNNRFHPQDLEGEGIVTCSGCGLEMPKQAPVGLFTFHSGVDQIYLHHLLAEESSMDNHGRWKWVQVRRDNHLLDCTVIAFAMADSEFDGGVRVIRRSRGAPQEDPNKMPPVNPVTQRPRGSWVKGW
jgi:phage terminase large subunit GpA-like protein